MSKSDHASRDDVRGLGARAGLEDRAGAVEPGLVGGPLEEELPGLGAELGLLLDPAAAVEGEGPRVVPLVISGGAREGDDAGREAGRAQLGQGRPAAADEAEVGGAVGDPDPRQVAQDAVRDPSARVGRAEDLGLLLVAGQVEEVTS